MDLQQLLDRMKQIEGTTTEVSQPVNDGCGDPMPYMPPKPETPPPSMSVNLNAHGLDDIESMMKLLTKVNPDMMPVVNKAMPSVSAAPAITSIKPMLEPLKMMVDFDADNDDRVGGEKDMGLPPDHDRDHAIVKTLDKDGDGDHDIDDHRMDKKEAYANEPNEEEKSVDYVLNKIAGGMNKGHGTYPKVSDGDNPMQKVTRMGESELRDQIRNDLRKRLAEIKGAE
jgi:hypothetical protein